LHLPDLQDPPGLLILGDLVDQRGLEDQECHLHRRDLRGQSILEDQRDLEDLESHLHRQDQQDLSILAGLEDQLGLEDQERHLHRQDL
jgi:hypothetical protein